METLIGQRDLETASQCVSGSGVQPPTRPIKSSACFKITQGIPLFASIQRILVEHPSVKGIARQHGRRQRILLFLPIFLTPDLDQIGIYNQAETKLANLGNQIEMRYLDSWLCMLIVYY